MTRHLLGAALAACLTGFGCSPQPAEVARIEAVRGPLAESQPVPLPAVEPTPAEPAPPRPSAEIARDVVTPPAAARATLPADWPGWLGPQGDGTSRETGLAAAFARDPEVVWRGELGTGHSGLTIAGGRVFTQYGREGRAFVAAFDAATGKPLWSFDAEEDYAEGRGPGPRSTPVVDGDRVYALAARGRLMSLDAATGRIVWDFSALEKFGERAHEEGQSPSPLVVGEYLVLPVGRSVRALEKGTGREVWKSLDEPMNHSSPILRTIGGTPQIVLLTGRSLVGLAPDTGAPLWSAPQEGVNIMTPVVAPDGTVFVGAAYGFGGQLIRVDADGARQVYATKNLAPHVATPVLHDGFLYGFDDRPGMLKCVEMSSGDEKWRTRETVKGSLLLVDGHLVVANEEGEVVVAPVSPRGFEPVSRRRVFDGGVCYAAPSFARGHLFVRSDRELACLRWPTQP